MNAHKFNRRIGLLASLILTLFTFTIPVNAAIYTYDDLGRLTSTTTASGASRSYTYDAGGNILSVVSQTSLAMISSDPEDQAVNIPVGQAVYMQFNLNIEQGDNFDGFSLMAGQDSIPIADSVYAQTLIVNPVNDLAADTAFTLHVPAGAVKAESGTLTNDEINLQFTTAAQGLNMTTSDPANNAGSVPVTQTIAITFNQDIQVGDNYANISLTAGGQTVSANNSVSANTLIIDPINDLPSNTTCTLLIPSGALKNMDSTSPNSEINKQFITG